MINLLQDIWGVITSFALVDYILYFAVVTLIILIVSLIYVIKNEKKEQLEQGVEIMNKTLEESDDLNLKDIVKTIDENPKPLIDMTAYEEEQEQKAIISYEELLKMDNPQTIAYSDEQLVDDLIPVKKIQLPLNDQLRETNNFAGLTLTKKEPTLEVDSQNVEQPKEVRLFSYEKEEAFLKALQQLNDLLND